jgi:cytochrome c peroxidase
VEVTGRAGDEMVFKVPVLRNIELTYPYFHDGQVATLDEAVELMGRLQLGREFSEDETKQLVAFLRALTGEQPQFALPQLPPSSASTPRPSPFAP